MTYAFVRLATLQFETRLYLLLTSADTISNSLDPDQARQSVGPDPDPNCLTLMVFLKECFKKVNFEEEKTRRLQKSVQNFTACNE